MNSPPTASPIDLTDLPAHLDPHSHINTITDTLHLSENVSNTAHTIINNAPVELTTGKNPAGVAGGAVYLASVQCVEKQRQVDIAEAAGVSTQTIRLRFQALAESDLE